MWKGRNLVACETFSNPDPYVMVCMEGTKQQTKVCNGTVNPKWDEVLSSLVRADQSSQLHLEVWNKNPVKDDFTGKYNISISELECGVVQDIWVPLQAGQIGRDSRPPYGCGFWEDLGLSTYFIFFFTQFHGK